MNKVIIRTVWTAAGLRRFEEEVNIYLDKNCDLAMISITGWLRHVCVAVLSKAEE